jgi:hypothetical protein
MQVDVYTRYQKYADFLKNQVPTAGDLVCMDDIIKEDNTVSNSDNDDEGFVSYFLILTLYRRSADCLI